MRQKDCLLVDSDDSEIPDLNLPITNVRKEEQRLFTRARRNAVIVKRQSCSVQIALILLISAIVIAVAFLGCFTSIIWLQLEQLRKDPRYEVVTQELEIIKREVNKIKLDVDLLRLFASSPETSIRNASSLLYARLEHIESQINGIADKVQEKFNDHLNNDTFNSISDRINAVENACIQGCGAVSKMVISKNKTKYIYDSVSDKLKKKRSKLPQWSFNRDAPIVFTRTQHV